MAIVVGEGGGIPLRLTRRSFVKSLLGGPALLAPGRRARAAGVSTTLKIHQATRNTWLGALGEALPKLGKPAPPFKAYDGYPRIELPQSRRAMSATLMDALTRTEPSNAAAPLTIDEVGRLLFLANGVTGQSVSGRDRTSLRAAPSAGALYSNEVYLAAERTAGVDPGVYYYDVLGDALVLIRPGAPAQIMGRALEQRQDAGAAAWIVLTNVFERYRWRYANRGYRYALIDSGHIGENIRLAAEAVGCAARRVERFADDVIHDLLAVDGRREAVCSIHAIRHTPERGARIRTLAPALPTKREGLDVVERYHETTKLITLPSRASETSAPHAQRERRTISRGEPDPTASLDAVIRKRRSAAQFQDRPISTDHMAFLTTTAGAPLPQNALDLLVILHRAQGFEPGLYRYDASRDRLELMRSGDLREPLARVSLGQRKAAQAGAAFLVVADLEAAVRDRGERVYRDLLIDAGALAQRLYLAAETVGLAARNLAAFTDDALNDLAGLDGRRRVALHLTVVGRGH